MKRATVQAQTQSFSSLDEGVIGPKWHKGEWPEKHMETVDFIGINHNSGECRPESNQVSLNLAFNTFEFLLGKLLNLS